MPTLDRRRKTPQQKQATANQRLRRRAMRRLRPRLIAAGLAADNAGTPLNFHATFSWHQFDQEETADLNFIQLSSKEQTNRLWRSLRCRFKSAGLEFIAARAPEYAKNRRHHLHLIGHAPDEATLLDIIETIRRVTGVGPRWTDLHGRRLGNLYGVVGLSPNGAWMLQRETGEAPPGNPCLVEYAAKADGKHKAEGQHRMSQPLLNLARRH